MEVLLDDKVIIVTGGAGLLGMACVNAIAENSGIPIISDLDKDSVINIKMEI